jgi:hypothetical protein
MQNKMHNQKKIYRSWLSYNVIINQILIASNLEFTQEFSITREEDGQSILGIQQ